MLKEKIIKYCDSLISWIILGIIFLIPLYFNVLTYTSFEIDKTILFRCLVEVMVFIYILRVLVSGRVLLASNKYFYFSLFFILLSQIISTLFSDHMYSSIWGSFLRGFGLFTYGHLLVFSFIVFQYFNKRNLKNYLYAIITAGAISSVYGLMQIYGLDFMKWQYIGVFHDRASSTLGQPNYFASYILLILPLTYYLFKIENKKTKIFLFLVLFVQFSALIVTYSRSSWLAFIASFVIFTLIYYRKNKKIFYFFSFLLIIGLVLVVCVNTANKIRVKVDYKASVTERLTGLVDFSEGGVKSRFFYYQAAIDVIKHGPVIGYGLDNQEYYYYKYYFPDYAIYGPINTYTDRAHNEVLDVLFTTGLIGFFAWTCLFFNITKRSIDALGCEMEKSKKNFILSLLFSLISFYFSILFGFFTIVPAIYFWFFIALLFRETSGDEKGEKEIVLNIRVTIKFLFLLVLFISLLYSIWGLNIKMNIANYYYREAKEKMLAGDYSRMFEYFNKVIAYSPKETYYRYQFPIDVLPVVLSFKEAEQRLNSLEYLKNILLDQDMKNITFEGRTFLAVILSEIGSIKIEQGVGIEKIKEFRRSDEIFAELISQAPGFSLLYWFLGDSYSHRKEYDKALEKYYQAYISYPDLNRDDLNAQHRSLIVDELILVYKKIIDVKIIQKEYKVAEELSEKALRLRPLDLELRSKLDTVRNLSGEKEKVINSLEHLTVIYPKDSNLYFQLAILYKSSGNIEMAKRNVLKAIKLDEKDIYKDFLKNLNNE